MSKKTISQLLIFCILGTLSAQTGFRRTGQVYVIDKDENELLDYTIPSSNSIKVSPLGSLSTGGFDAMGFRTTDNCLYAICVANNHLFRFSAGVVSEDLGNIGLTPNLYYLAGDVSPDGRFHYCVGADAGGHVVHLAKIDLTSSGFPIQFINLSGLGLLSDITCDPQTGKLYGFDHDNHRMVLIDPVTGVNQSFPPIGFENDIYGLYFDAFNDLYAVGNTLGGIVDAYFMMDKNTGKETRLATGALSRIADVASCPYSVELTCDVSPGNNLPCTDAVFTYNLVNGSNATFEGLELVHKLPNGFTFESVLSNSFGAIPDTSANPGAITLSNIKLSPGSRQLSIKVYVGDIPKGKYNSQAVINKLPDGYGSCCLSNYPKLAGFEDSTVFNLKRFDQDSLHFNLLLCHGETLELESGDYGDNIVWNTGSDKPNLLVQTGGLYSFTSGSTCEQVYVEHEVTSVSCPYTIEMKHIIEPDSTFACSEVIFNFYVNNDSGEPRYDITFYDELPAGFSFLSVLKNPYGGTVDAANSDSIIRVQHMTIHPGRDTLRFLVRLNQIPPGTYKNRARITGFPQIIGPLRLSDDPKTVQPDSSRLIVKGIIQDSMLFHEKVCPNASIVLDASYLGQSFLWENGSTSSSREVISPGIYFLSVLDGCEPRTVMWDVAGAMGIEVEPILPIMLHQGDSTVLHTVIHNEGQDLDIQWHDPAMNTLSCLQCPDPVAKPLHNNVYSVIVSNEECSDTTIAELLVDDSRRLYFPNAFSPNDDGVNDRFYFSSPDYAMILSLSVFDRWGNLVFLREKIELQPGHPFWDGTFEGKLLSPGVYFWCAKIKFIDDDVQVFTGDITLLR